MMLIFRIQYDNLKIKNKDLKLKGIANSEQLRLSLKKKIGVELVSHWS